MLKIKTEDAIGQTLCHDVTGIKDGWKGATFKRGHVVTQEDVPALLDIGKSHVFIWEAEADEVHEDDAALAAAEAVCGPGIDYDKTPSEGKVFMYAMHDGLFAVNREALRHLNAIGDYTLVAIPDMFSVTEREKLGGLRIIPLVTKRANVDTLVKDAKESYPVFTVLPYKKLKCGVVITGSEIFYGRIQDKFEPILREKLGKFGAEFLGAVKCPDDLDMINGAVAEFMAKGAELILLTGGMSVDPDDLTPTAMRASGARIVTQGMPMQPGNMLTIAYHDDTVLIGVPGASIHAPVTSLDVFLPRVFAGVEITPEDIPGLGNGGFCLGCKVCAYPRCYFGRGY